MWLYPVGLELSGQAVMVVGGGEVAFRKVESLLQAGALVTVVSPALAPGLADLHRRQAIRWLAREFRPGDLEGFTLAMAATDDETVNRRVSAEARSRCIPVNVCDVPELCSFTVPAVVRQGALTLAVFTGGKSPLLAGRLREELQAQFGPEYAAFLEILGALRPRLKREVPDPARRQAIYRRLVDSDALDLLRRGERSRVEAMIEEAVAQASV